MKAQTKDVHIYFPRDVYLKLKQKAKAERRTVSAEVVIAVEERIKQWTHKN